MTTDKFIFIRESVATPSGLLTFSSFKDGREDYLELDGEVILRGAKCSSVYLYYKK